jgi:hypothetical protein
MKIGIRANGDDIERWVMGEESEKKHHEYVEMFQIKSVLVSCPLSAFYIPNLIPIIMQDQALQALLP